MEVLGHELSHAVWTLADPERARHALALRSGRLEPLAEAREFSIKPWILPDLAEWTVTAWMGLDADDMPLITVRRDTTALYSLDWEAP